MFNAGEQWPLEAHYEEQSKVADAMDVSLVWRVIGVLLFGVQAGSVDGRESR